MIIFGSVIAFWCVSTIATYTIKCHIINKNCEDFRKLSKNLNIPSNLRYYMEESLDQKPVIIDCIPGINILEALKAWFYRKDDMRKLKNDLAKFEFKYGALRDFVWQDNYKIDDDIGENEQEYLVCYFVNGRPINICFNFDGVDNVYINANSSEVFKSLDYEVQIEMLLQILYLIYMGVNKYISCFNIYEIFTEEFVQKLKNKFENIEIYDYPEKFSSRDLLRRKPK